MMRLCLLALLLATPALADTIPATSRITSVTIYPQGAEVTREVTFSAPKGVHDLIVTDLPAETEPALLRLSSADTDLGAFALRTDRLPPSEQPKSATEIAAEAEVDAARTALDQAEATLAAVNARIEAQTARIAFLSGLKTDTAGQTAETLTAIADMVATQVLEARTAALAAQADLPAATRALARAQEDLARAEAARDALAQGAEGKAALIVAVTAKGGEGRMTVTHYVQQASWRPVYDLRLDRKAGKVQLERGLLVSQEAGEDWQSVDLTLSTAQPGTQAEASQLWPDRREVRDPAAQETADAQGGMAEPLAAAPAVEARSITAGLEVQGNTVTYHYPTPVSIASGVEDLRLALDAGTLPAEVLALAVPRYDRTAFLQAKVTNSGELLLPGTAFLYRDGMLTAQAEMPLLAPGDSTTFGFGPIPALKLTREMPLKSTGDRGVFTSSTEQVERAVLKVENLGDEAWTLRVLDQVPYSEQDELKIDWTAAPPPSVQDLEGQRGVLAWDFDLAGKETKEITLETTLSWPAGKELQ